MDGDSDDILMPDGARAALALLAEEPKDNGESESESESKTTSTTTTTTDQKPLLLQLVCQRTEQDQIEVFQRRPSAAAAAAASAAGTTRDGKDEVLEDVDEEEFIRLLQILQVQWMTNSISSSTVSGGVAAVNGEAEDAATRFWHISFDSSHDVFYDDMSKMDSIQRLFEEGLSLNNNNNNNSRRRGPGAGTYRCH
mmetsp:Transcript_57937/g.141553  ORF Transcript_57937/g.141553 Transcript_57937/m.141553 type:complete len:196 (+) Transcript_57937:220-807(+)